MAQNPADCAVDAQDRPGDPGLGGLDREAGSDGDNRSRTDAIRGRETDGESDRRQRDRNCCAAARDMLSADLENLGSRTSGDDAETADHEPHLRYDRNGAAGSPKRTASTAPPATSGPASRTPAKRVHQRAASARADGDRTSQMGAGDPADAAATAGRTTAWTTTPASTIDEARQAIA